MQTYVKQEQRHVDAMKKHCESTQKTVKIF